MNRAKRVSILGVTGSVGQSAKDVLIEARDLYDVVAVTAYTRVDELIRDAIALDADLAVIGDTDLYDVLKVGLAGSGIEVAAGLDAIREAACRPCDILVAAIVGAAGLLPIVDAIEQGTTVALANKETLVCAGDVVMQKAAQFDATLLPIDSEHSAIFQVYNPKHCSQVRSITLTASGGPFRTWSGAEMLDITVDQALSHPNWEMGTKISIDSATMMNKGLEVIEAAHFFPVSSDNIKVLIHPQSIIHGMVEYSDGSMLAQLGTPDMRTPVGVALAWPSRHPLAIERLNLVDVGQLTFEAPDVTRFPLFALARECLKKGSAACAVLNAANEVAVDAFLKRRITYLDIAKIVEKTLHGMDASRIDSIHDAIQFDRVARKRAAEIII